MKVYQLVLVLTSLFLLGFGIYKTDPYNKETFRNATVVGKMLVDGGKHIAHPTLGLRLEDGKLIDIEVSVAQYSQFEVGQPITIPKTDREIYPKFHRELVSFLSFMTAGLSGTFALIILITGFFSGFTKEMKEL